MFFFLTSPPKTHLGVGDVIDSLRFPSSLMVVDGF